MFEILKESKNNILGVRASGKLTDDDYKDIFLPAIADLLKEYGTCRIVFFCDEKFEGWTPKAMWDDANFGRLHMNDFDKIAIVGAPKWVSWAAKLDAHIMKGEIKSFSHNELNQAWEWIEI